MKKSGSASVPRDVFDAAGLGEMMNNRSDVKDRWDQKMIKASRTVGEILFEQHLETQKLAFEFEKEHAGKAKKPWNSEVSGE